MSAIRTSKPKKRFGECRKCLVCGGKTISAHLGMDVCRACSVFYRRSNGKREYECRAGTNKCQVNKGSSCRKCRLDRIDELLGSCGDAAKLALFSEESSPTGTPSLAGDSEETHRSEPSGSREVSKGSSVKSTSILENVRSAYRNMCQIRLTSELLARPNPPHPMLMNDQEFPLEQATIGTMNNSNRIFISSVAGFGKAAFPEYAAFSKEHQWKMVKNFSYRFGAFESSYRANTAFPHDPERLFSGYTYWFTHHYDARFYSDCPNKIDVGHVTKSMFKHCKDHHASFRSFMRRLNLKESEFMYIAAIMFWSLDGLELPESVTAVAAKCRERIMQELHVYFKEECGTDNYAARLGELLTAIQMFDKSEMIKENFEFLRLMNVFNDDEFVYKLQRDDGEGLRPT